NQVADSFGLDFKNIALKSSLDSFSFFSVVAVDDDDDPPISLASVLLLLGSTFLGTRRVRGLCFNAGIFLGLSDGGINVVVLILGTSFTSACGDVDSPWLCKVFDDDEL